MSINSLELKDLQYVDGLPDEGQTRIRWIRDGDELTGARTKNGNEGFLNEAGVSIQKNVLRLEENSITAKDKINELVENVNNINVSLEMSGDVDIVRQVGINKENIGILQEHVQFAENNIGELQLNYEVLNNDIGAYDPAADSFYRTIRNNIVWIKKELGQYTGQDINGQVVIGNEATGMKRRILDNTLELVNQEGRLRELESNYHDSDIGSLTLEVNRIRRELGPTSSAKSDNTYLRLNSLENRATASERDITNLETFVGFNSTVKLVDRVSVNETNIRSLTETINAPVTGVLPRVNLIEAGLGNDLLPTSTNGKVFILRTDVDSLYSIVGKDTSSGLRADVSWLNRRVGIVPQGEIPGNDTVFGMLNTLSSAVTENSATIQDLQVEIGNNNEGLKGSVLKLNTTVYGTNPNGTTVVTRGLLASVELHESALASRIPEAPMDGKAYVRRNGAWVDITTL